MLTSDSLEHGVNVFCQTHLVTLVLFVFNFVVIFANELFVLNGSSTCRLR